MLLRHKWCVCPYDYFGIRALWVFLDGGRGCIFQFIAKKYSKGRSISGSRKISPLHSKIIEVCKGATRFRTRAGRITMSSLTTYKIEFIINLYLIELVLKKNENNIEDYSQEVDVCSVYSWVAFKYFISEREKCEIVKGRSIGFCEVLDNNWTTRHLSYWLPFFTIVQPFEIAIRPWFGRCGLGTNTEGLGSCGVVVLWFIINVLDGKVNDEASGQIMDLTLFMSRRFSYTFRPGGGIPTLIQRNPQQSVLLWLIFDRG